MSTAGETHLSSQDLSGSVYFLEELLESFSIPRVKCREFQPDVSTSRSAVGFRVTGS